METSRNIPNYKKRIEGVKYNIEILLNILKYIAEIIMWLANGILWCLSIFDIFGIGKTLNGSSGKESISQIATENLPDNKDL